MVRLLVARAAEHPSLQRGEPPPRFLGPREEEAYRALAFPARRLKWLMGRWAAKHLLAEALGLSPGRFADLTVANAPSGAPYAELDGRLLPWSFSISHREDLAFCALCLDPAVRVGADLERVLPREPALVRTFFTAAEEARVGEAPPEAVDGLVARIWSAKEAVLKVLELGLRLDTRRIEVGGEGGPGAGLPEGFTPLDVAVRSEGDPYVPPAPLVVGFRDEGSYVLTLALAPAASGQWESPTRFPSGSRT